MPEQSPSSMDDIVQDNQKEVIADAERTLTSRCPFLSKAGNFFYYCGKGMPPGIKPEPKQFNLVAQSGVGSTQLQLFCMDRYQKCIYYQGIDPSPADRAIAQRN